ncbi:MAG: hypothetical protein Q4C61_16945 [Lachnospiraceae bacterium]|nr:hypothetical protein [Lachnospiraceae bacterium]
MKKYGREIRKTMEVFTGTVVLGFLFMCLVYVLPTERVALHVRETGMNMVQLEDEYYRPMIPGKSSTILDNYTDTLMLLTAAYDGKENVVDKAVNNYRICPEDKTMLEGCSVVGLNQGGKQTAYARYWHGYLVVLKPLLLFFNLNEIRDINVFFILLGISIIMILMYKNRLQKYIVPLLVAVAFMNPMTISASIQFSTIFYTVVVSLIVLLLFNKKKWFADHIWIYFMLVGMLTSYVDLLTYPIAAFGFPIIMYFALHENVAPREGAVKFAGCSFMWGFGYAGMWGSKWLLSSILMRKNYFERAFDKIKERSGHTVQGETVTGKQVLDAMLNMIRINPVRYLMVAVALLTIILAVLAGIQWSNKAASILILAAACSPFAWYLATQNHSAIHSWFTYRGLGVFVFGISGFLLPLFDGEKLLRRIRRK